MKLKLIYNQEQIKETKEALTHSDTIDFII